MLIFSTLVGPGRGFGERPSATGRAMRTAQDTDRYSIPFRSDQVGLVMGSSPSNQSGDSNEADMDSAARARQSMGPVGGN